MVTEEINFKSTLVLGLALLLTSKEHMSYDRFILLAQSCLVPWLAGLEQNPEGYRVDGAGEVIVRVVLHGERRRWRCINITS